MPIETPINGIWSLNSNNPAAGDKRSEGDDHLRLIKDAIKKTFPNINDIVNASDEELNILVGALITVTELNYLEGVTSSIQNQFDDPTLVHTDETNIFTKQQTLRSGNASPLLLQLDDESPTGTGNPYAQFTRGSSGARGAILQNVNSVASPNGYFQIYRNNGTTIASFLALSESGAVTLQNLLHGAFIQIDSGGNIKISGATEVYKNDISIPHINEVNTAISAALTASRAPNSYHDYGDQTASFTANWATGANAGSHKKATNTSSNNQVDITIANPPSNTDEVLYFTLRRIIDSNTIRILSCGNVLNPASTSESVSQPQGTVTLMIKKAPSGWPAAVNYVVVGRFSATAGGGW